MARQKRSYRCTECDKPHVRPAGRCTGCGSWETVVEVVEPTSGPAAQTIPGIEMLAAEPVYLEEVDSEYLVRLSTGMSEFDRVIGGGLVEGSITLLSGDPGVGKSTLIGEVAERISVSTGRHVFYAGGEERAEQVRARLKRIRGGARLHTEFYAETNVDLILNHVAAKKPPVLIIDSIQTMYDPELEGRTPGSQSQVERCGHKIQWFAKKTGIPVIIIGQVIKDGTTAGPNTLRHAVDALITLSGGDTEYVFARVDAKNRYGSTDEVGVFRMTEAGLENVTNPSEAFLRVIAEGQTGAVVAPIIEGSRPILAGLETLIAPAAYGYPQRNTWGFDKGRLGLLSAVLHARVGVDLSQMDLYVNVAGGITIKDPGTDLAVCMALLSSALNTPIPSTTAFVAEVSLSGHLIPAKRTERRVAELSRLGYRRVYVPDGARVNEEGEIEIRQVSTLVAAVTAELGQDALAPYGRGRQAVERRAERQEPRGTRRDAFLVEDPV